MPPAKPLENNILEVTLQSLQEEREACVARLRRVLQQTESAEEAQGYLRRIDNINAALVRLAASGLQS
ncbi:MAG: hypothetical protein ACK5JT_19475 [Hyphomicrobiaceae bacterium]